MQKQIRSLGSTLVLTAILACIYGCDSAKPIAPNRALSVARSVSPLAASKSRGIEDVFLQIEKSLPGFGGFYVDSAGDVEAFVSNMADQAVATALLSNWLKANTDVMLRPHVARILIHPGQYSFSQLVDWSTRIRTGAEASDNIALIDADESRNRVRLVVRSSAALANIPALAVRLGIPPGAIAAELGNFTVRSTTRLDLDKDRPSVAGFAIRHYFNGDSAEGCTLGINVTVNKVAHFLTASHCNVTFTGETGQTWDQPDLPDFVGTTAINPAWSTIGCVPGATYCRDTDAMLVKYNSVIPIGRIAESSVIGTTGPGDRTLGSTYKVTTEPPRMVGDSVYKTGAFSGTTRGVVSGSCVMTPPDALTHNSVNCAELANMYSEPGDSGAPVYYWRIPLAADVRVAEGVQWAVGHDASGNVYTLYSTLSQIQSDLGVSFDVIPF